MNKPRTTPDGHVVNGWDDIERYSDAVRHSEDDAQRALGAQGRIALAFGHDEHSGAAD